MEMAAGRKLTQAEIRMVGKVYSMHVEGNHHPIMDLVNSLIETGDTLMLDFLVTYGHLKSGRDREVVKKILLSMVLH
jgi:hypothetical protein